MSNRPMFASCLMTPVQSVNRRNIFCYGLWFSDSFSIQFLGKLGMTFE